MRARRLCFAALMLLAAAPPVAVRSAAPAVPVVVIDGKGFGHGVGMAQDGAFWMAKAGASTNQILGQFYPGTSIARATGNTDVRVPVLASTDGEVIVSFPSGGEIRDAPSGAQSPGFPMRFGPGAQATVRYEDGRYRVGTASAQSAAAGSREATTGVAVVGPAAPTDASTSTTSPSPTLPEATTTTTNGQQSPPPSTTTTRPAPAPATSPGASSGRPLWAIGSTVGVPARNRVYRGALEATAATGTLRLVDQVDVEQYLRGMGEVRDPSWPAAALRAQAIASRTYALRAMAVNGELCDDQRCQVYLGASAEYKAMDKAVADTKGQAIVYGRSLASAVYSSNGGGYSASREEGFGTAGGAYPYLRAAPYTTSDPKPWSVKVALTDVAARLGYGGRVSALTVARSGPSGRALSVTVEGTAGPKVVSGIAFDKALGLKSTLFTLRVDTAAAPPPPPPSAGGGGLQALPEEVGGIQPIGIFIRVPATAPDVPTTDVPRAKAGLALAPLDRRHHGIPGLRLVAFVLLAAVVAAAVPLALGNAGVPDALAWIRTQVRALRS